MHQLTEEKDDRMTPQNTVVQHNKRRKKERKMEKTGNSLGNSRCCSTYSLLWPRENVNRNVFWIKSTASFNIRVSDNSLGNLYLFSSWRCYVALAALLAKSSLYTYKSIRITI
jgi:hypothetical protein